MASWEIMPKTCKKCRQIQEKNRENVVGEHVEIVKPNFFKQVFSINHFFAWANLLGA